jgi:hypothetical protein
MVLDKMGVPAALPPRPEQYTSLHGSKIQKQKFPVHLKRSVYIDFREVCFPPWWRASVFTQHNFDLQNTFRNI